MNKFYFLLQVMELMMAAPIFRSRPAWDVGIPVALDVRSELAWMVGSLLDVI